MLSSGINGVVFTSVLSEKTYIYFRYETKARKVMVDFKFDALYS